MNSRKAFVVKTHEDNPYDDSESQIKSDFSANISLQPVGNEYKQSAGKTSHQQDTHENLKEYARAALANGDLAASMDYFLEALESAKKTKRLAEVTEFINFMAKTMNEAAMQNLGLENMNTRLSILYKCEEIMNPGHYGLFREMRVMTYNNIACIYRRKGDLKRALNYLERASALLSGQNDAYLKGMTFLNFCAVHSQNSKHDVAKSFALKSIMSLQEPILQVTLSMSPGLQDGLQTEEWKNLKNLLIIAYHNLGLEEEYLENWKGALDAHRKGLAYVTKWFPQNEKLIQKMKTGVERVLKFYSEVQETQLSNPLGHIASGFLTPGNAVKGSSETMLFKPHSTKSTIQQGNQRGVALRQNSHARTIESPPSKAQSTRGKYPSPKIVPRLKDNFYLHRKSPSWCVPDSNKKAQRVADLITAYLSPTNVSMIEIKESSTSKARKTENKRIKLVIPNFEDEPASRQVTNGNSDISIKSSKKSGSITSKQQDLKNLFDDQLHGLGDIAKSKTEMMSIIDRRIESTKNGQGYFLPAQRPDRPIGPIQPFFIRAPQNRGHRKVVGNQKEEPNPEPTLSMPNYLLSPTEILTPTPVQNRKKTEVPSFRTYPTKKTKYTMKSPELRSYEEAAITIQKYVRGRQVRQKLQKMKKIHTRSKHTTLLKKIVSIDFEDDGDNVSQPITESILMNLTANYDPRTLTLHYRAIDLSTGLQKYEISQGLGAILPDKKDPESKDNMVFLLNYVDGIVKRFCIKNFALHLRPQHKSLPHVTSQTEVNLAIALQKEEEFKKLKEEEEVRKLKEEEEENRRAEEEKLREIQRQEEEARLKEEKEREKLREFEEMQLMEQEDEYSTELRNDFMAKLRQENAARQKERQEARLRQEAERKKALETATRVIQRLVRGMLARRAKAYYAPRPKISVQFGKILEDHFAQIYVLHEKNTARKLILRDMCHPRRGIATYIPLPEAFGENDPFLDEETILSRFDFDIQALKITLKNDINNEEHLPLEPPAPSKEILVCKFSLLNSFEKPIVISFTFNPQDQIITGTVRTTDDGDVLFVQNLSREWFDGKVDGEFLQELDQILKADPGIDYSLSSDKLALKLASVLRVVFNDSGNIVDFDLQSINAKITDFGTINDLPASSPEQQNVTVIEDEKPQVPQAVTVEAGPYERHSYERDRNSSQAEMGRQSPGKGLRIRKEDSMIEERKEHEQFLEEEKMIPNSISPINTVATPIEAEIYDGLLFLSASIPEKQYANSTLKVYSSPEQLSSGQFIYDESNQNCQAGANIHIKTSLPMLSPINVIIGQEEEVIVSGEIDITDSLIQGGQWVTVNYSKKENQRQISGLVVQAKFQRNQNSDEVDKDQNLTRPSFPKIILEKAKTIRDMTLVVRISEDKGRHPQEGDIYQVQLLRQEDQCILNEVSLPRNQHTPQEIYENLTLDEAFRIVYKPKTEEPQIDSNSPHGIRTTSSKGTSGHQKSKAFEFSDDKLNELVTSQPLKKPPRLNLKRSGLQEQDGNQSVGSALLRSTIKGDNRQKTPPTPPWQLQTLHIQQHTSSLPNEAGMLVCDIVYNKQDRDLPSPLSVDRQKSIISKEGLEDGRKVLKIDVDAETLEKHLKPSRQQQTLVELTKSLIGAVRFQNGEADLDYEAFAQINGDRQNDWETKKPTHEKSNVILKWKKKGLKGQYLIIFTQLDRMSDYPMNENRAIGLKVYESFETFFRIEATNITKKDLAPLRWEFTYNFGKYLSNQSDYIEIAKYFKKRIEIFDNTLLVSTEKKVTNRFSKDVMILNDKYLRVIQNKIRHRRYFKNVRKYREFLKDRSDFILHKQHILIRDNAFLFVVEVFHDSSPKSIIQQHPPQHLYVLSLFDIKTFEKVSLTLSLMEFAPCLESDIRQTMSLLAKNVSLDTFNAHPQIVVNMANFRQNIKTKFVAGKQYPSTMPTGLSLARIPEV